jgi:histidine triad (HIT) family protein
MQNNETIFSKIIHREIPAEIVYEDEGVLAFLDISPTNPGHTLVIPKPQSTNIVDITPASWAHVMETVRILAPKIQKAVGADGINLMMNNGEIAGQLVMHTHVHIIPRFANDGYTHWPGHPYAEGEREKVGAKIRATLSQKNDPTVL